MQTFRALVQLYFIGFVFDGIILMVNGQYGSCDYYQNIAVGSIYPLFSPGYERNSNYTGGTNCRWTAQTDARYQIVLNCQEMALPNVCICGKIDLNSANQKLFCCFFIQSNGCTRDRIVVSRSGSSSFTDGQSACGSTRFFVQSFSNQMALGKFLEYLLNL